MSNQTTSIEEMYDNYKNLKIEADNYGLEMLKHEMNSEKWKENREEFDTLLDEISDLERKILDILGDRLYKLSNGKYLYYEEVRNRYGLVELECLNG